MSGIGDAGPPPYEEEYVCEACEAAGVTTVRTFTCKSEPRYYFRRRCYVCLASGRTSGLPKELVVWRWTRDVMLWLTRQPANSTIYEGMGVHRLPPGVTHDPANARTRSQPVPTAPRWEGEKPPKGGKP